MELENKVLSRELQQHLYESELTLGTAESCTGGRIAEAIIATPGSSEYFKGGIICYTDEIKTKLLNIDSKLIEEKNAVSEEVAIEMVKGAIETLNVDFAISATGFAGPGGGTKEIPIGTIWLACGNKDEIITHKLEEDEGRDVNLSVATSKAMQMIVKFIIDHEITKNS